MQTLCAEKRSGMNRWCTLLFLMQGWWWRERERFCVSVCVCWVRVLHIKSYHHIYYTILVKSRSYTSGVKSPEHDANMTSLSHAPCWSLAQPRPCPLPVLKQLLWHLCLMPGGWQRQGCVRTAPWSAPPGSASAHTSDWSPAQPDSRQKLWHQEPSTTWWWKTTWISGAQHNLMVENNLDIRSPAQPDSRKQPWHQEPSTTWWWKTTWISGAQHNLMVENNLDIKSPAQPDSRKQPWHQEPSTTWQQKTTLTSSAQHNWMPENNLDIKSTTWWQKKTSISGSHNLMAKN